MSDLDYYCFKCKQFLVDEWATHVLRDEGTPEQVMVRTIKELIEAGNGIRCYPSGAVGFDEWTDAMDQAEFVLKKFLDEDGNWHPMEPA